MTLTDADFDAITRLLPACSDILDGSDRRRAAWHALRDGTRDLLEALRDARREVERLRAEVADLAAARLDAATCRAVAEEAIAIARAGWASRQCGDPARTSAIGATVDLRARLAHPDAERLRGMVLDLCLASEAAALDNRAATVRRRDDAERALLAALGVPDR